MKFLAEENTLWKAVRSMQVGEHLKEAVWEDGRQAQICEPPMFLVCLFRSAYLYISQKVCAF